MYLLKKGSDIEEMEIKKQLKIILINCFHETIFRTKTNAKLKENQGSATHSLKKWILCIKIWLSSAA